MTRPLSEDFESISEWTAVGTATITQPAGRTGLGLDIAGGSGSNGLAYNLAAPDQQATLVVGFAYKADLGSSHPICEFRSDAGATLHEQVLMSGATTGDIRVNMGATPIATSAGGVLTVGTWAYIELRVTLGDSPNGAVVVRVNGIEVINATGLDTKNGGTKTVFDQWRLVRPALSAGNHNQYDDAYLSAGAAEPFLGDPAAGTLTGQGTAVVTFAASATALAGLLTGGSASVTFTADAMAFVTAFASGTAVVTFAASAIPAGGPAFGAGTSGLMFAVAATGIGFTPGQPTEVLVEIRRPDGTWDDISCDVRTIDISTGREDVLEQFQAGTLTLSMANFEGVNSAWPPDSIWAQTGRYRTNVPIRVSIVHEATIERLFTGTTDAVDDSWPGTVDAMVTVTATDGFKLLARYDNLGRDVVHWADDFEPRLMDHTVTSPRGGDWVDYFEAPGPALGPDWELGPPPSPAGTETLHLFTIDAGAAVGVEATTTTAVDVSSIQRVVGVSAGGQYIEIEVDNFWQNPDPPTNYAAYYELYNFIDPASPYNARRVAALNYDGLGLQFSAYSYTTGGSISSGAGGDGTPAAGTVTFRLESYDDGRQIVYFNGTSVIDYVETAAVGSGIQQGIYGRWQYEAGTVTAPRMNVARGGPLTGAAT